MVGMRKTVGALVLFGMLTLAGCVDGNPIPTLPPTPSATPIFASEEEALAAAEAAYAAYLEMSALISSEGGVNPERIADVVTGDLLESSLDGFETLRNQGLHTVGISRVTGVTLQLADLPTEDQASFLVAYFCVDYSDVDVVDGNGASVVSPDRPDLQAFEVSFDLLEDVVLPSDLNPWEASQVCSISQ